MIARGLLLTFIQLCEVTHDYLIKYFTPHCLLRDIIIITLFMTSLSIFVLQETLGNSDNFFSE